MPVATARRPKPRRASAARSTRPARSASAGGVPAKAAGISSEAVHRRTGRTWPEWVKALDAAGCRDMSHSQIAELVHGKFGVGDWWSQMVTVGYEQATGRRVKHQTADGFKGSASKTVDVPVSDLYRAWDDPGLRRRWLGKEAPFVIRKATASKSMRITAADGKTRLEVNFYPKGPGKSQVAVQIDRLADARAVERAKASWAAALATLKTLLER